MELISFSGKKTKVSEPCKGLYEASTLELLNRYEMDSGEIKEVIFIHTDLYKLDLQPLKNVKHIGFDGDRHKVGVMFTPNVGQYIIENLPTTLDFIACSSGTTITNFDELLEQSVRLKMR